MDMAMIMAMTTDIMRFLTPAASITMISTVTAATFTADQGVGPVIGDEIEEPGDYLNPLRFFPLQC